MKGDFKMKKLAIVLMVTVLGLGVASVRADLAFNDGLVHDIDYRIPPDQYGGELLSVYDGPGPTPTTVNFMEGGWAWDVYANNSSLFNMYGGYIHDGLFARDSSLVNVYGGFVNQDLMLSGNGFVNVFGGTIDELLFTYDNSVCNIYGGTINADIHVRDSSVLNIYGADFMVDGNPVGYGPLTASTDAHILTGTLHMGDSLAHNYFRFLPDTATINLIEMEIVPLPGAVLFGMIGLSIAGVRLRKHA